WPLRPIERHHWKGANRKRGSHEQLDLSPKYFDKQWRRLVSASNNPLERGRDEVGYRFESLRSRIRQCRRLRGYSCELVPPTRFPHLADHQQSIHAQVSFKRTFRANPRASPSKSYGNGESPLHRRHSPHVTRWKTVPAQSAAVSARCGAFARSVVMWQPLVDGQ